MSLENVADPDRGLSTSCAPPVATAERSAHACASSTPMDACEPVGKRPKGEGHSGLFAAALKLTPLQTSVLDSVVQKLDTEDVSVVITNPREKDAPIVHVTELWQHMCGFTACEAVGQNPRIVQGPPTDRTVARAISEAVREERSCKVLLLNFRRGDMSQPFWNMLSISVIKHRGELMFYMAALQDYTYNIEKLISLSPMQFCRSAECHQRGRYVKQIDRDSLPVPMVYEADLGVELQNAIQETPAGPMVKRLGWGQLKLEPEVMISIIIDVLQQLGAQYELKESYGPDGAQFAVYARLEDVAFRVLVANDTKLGSYRVSCTRMSGDTFGYHKIFQMIKSSVSDEDVDSWRRRPPFLLKEYSGKFQPQDLGTPTGAA
ncbi:hypothetical protein AB1Y20_010389 [Prymnesium parvum]|uniref:Non-specific serine/threonine protein kinase n=1 Tax=Prymnesium parvum TaxID=97485 RepID=A0AB34IQY6_PRYPA